MTSVYHRARRSLYARKPAARATNPEQINVTRSNITAPLFPEHTANTPETRVTKYTNGQKGEYQDRKARTVQGTTIVMVAVTLGTGGTVVLAVAGELVPQAVVTGVVDVQGAATETT